MNISVEIIRKFNKKSLLLSSFTHHNCIRRPFETNKAVFLELKSNQILFFKFV